MEFVEASRVWTGEAWRGATRVVVQGGLITALESLDAAPPLILAPGFIDLQVNGIADVDVASADGSEWDCLDTYLLQQGTTAWCPTVVTGRLDRYTSCFDRVRTAMGGDSDGSLSILGLHLEGPFLGGAPGAHRREHLRPIDLDWLAALPEQVRLVTLAPELPDAAKAVASLRGKGCVVSLGHTRATSVQFDQAVSAGATMVTHLFNGMSGVHHRDDGVALAALTDSRVVAGLIVDLVHVQRRAVALAFAAKGASGVALVTDAVAWRAGRVGSVQLAMVDGAPRLPDGTLAGSALTMDQAIRNCVACGVPLEHALTAASTTPARLLGDTSRGAIEVGRRADLVGLDEALAVQQVWRAGRTVLGPDRTG